MSDKPNILIIYPDQMRADAMGCAGNKVVKTPNIDRLANEGTHFTEAYTSYPYLLSLPGLGCDGQVRAGTRHDPEPLSAARRPNHAAANDEG